MTRKVYTISNQKAASSSDIPVDQFISEDKKDEQWYYSNITQYARYYNIPINYTSQASFTSNVQTDNYGGTQRFPAQFMIRMLQYYQGQQPNLDYNHLVQDVYTTNRQAEWIKGQKIAELVNNTRGIVVSKLSNAKFEADSIGSDIQSEKELLLNLLDFKRSAPELFSFLEKISISISPENNMETAPDWFIQSKEELEIWFNKTYKAKTASVYKDLADGIWFSNAYMTKAAQAFMHTYICSLTMMEHSMVDNRPFSEVIKPYYAIIDKRQDDDFGFSDEFRGWVRPFTMQQLFKTYPELVSVKDAIYEIARNTQQAAQLNNGWSNIMWMPKGATNSISVCKMFWRGWKLTGKKVVKNKYGSERLVDEDVEMKDGEFAKETMYQGILVANKWLIRCGETENQVESLYEPGSVEFPIQRFMPNMFLGESRSEVARLHQLQDELDAFDFKIRTMIGDAKGKKTIIYSDNFTNSPDEFFKNLAQHNIIPAKRSGEANDETNRLRNTDVLDLTLDPNIQYLHQIYVEREQRMEKIASTSKVALGQQGYYVGLQSQQQTIAQNNLGLGYIIDGFLDFMVMNVRYAANMAKNVYIHNAGEQVPFLIGSEGVKFLKFTEGMTFEQIFVSLRIHDQMDDAKQARLGQYLQAVSQNPQDSGMTFLDILDVEQANSLTKITDKLKYEFQKRKKEQQMKEEGAMQSQQQAEEMKMEIAQMKEDNANYRSDTSNETKIIISKMDSLMSAIQLFAQQKPGQEQQENQMGQQEPPQEERQQEAQEVPIG